MASFLHIVNVKVTLASCVLAHTVNMVCLYLLCLSVVCRRTHNRVQEHGAVQLHFGRLRTCMHTPSLSLPVFQLCDTHIHRQFLSRSLMQCLSTFPSPLSCLFLFPTSASYTVPRRPFYLRCLILFPSLLSLPIFYFFCHLF